MLKCLEAIHLTQTGSLLSLLIEKFLNTHHLSVARICDAIACRRVEMLLAENQQVSEKHLPVALSLKLWCISNLCLSLFFYLLFYLSTGTHCDTKTVNLFSLICDFCQF